MFLNLSILSLLFIQIPKLILNLIYIIILLTIFSLKRSLVQFFFFFIKAKEVNPHYNNN